MKIDLSRSVPAARRVMEHYVPIETTKNRNNWCGPYAVAVVARCSYDEAYLSCLRATGKDRIMGLNEWGVIETLKRIGIKAQSDPHWMNKGKTFTQWYNDLNKYQRAATYIVTVGNHYVIYKNGWLIDNHSKKWQRWKDRKGKGSYKRARLRNAILITG
jgi:hypothetical protein